MSEREFYKMHGAGNDYIYFDCLDTPFSSPSKWAQSLSDRHFGVGGDGIVLICPSDVADCKMRMFNMDGSEGRMCGNAIRCVGRYMYEKRQLKKDTVTVETLSGIKTLKINARCGKVKLIDVEMGKADFCAKNIPVISDGEDFIKKEHTYEGITYTMTALSMGNPHNVIFMESSPDILELEKIGPHFENLEIFPQRVNTEFVRKLDDTTLEMRVWERGSGETLACGTGACATVAAAVKLGLVKPCEKIKVVLRGGELFITVSEEYDVIMSGGAEFVFRGYVNL